MRILLALLLVCLAGLAAAQTVTPPDYDEWRRLADRAERILAIDGMSEEGLIELRGELAAARARMLAAQDVNAARIESLRQELAALGPPPEEGESEPADIAAMRTELNQELELLLAPRRAAQAAYSRADGLISELDMLLRRREARELFSRGPSPLNPSAWASALQDLAVAAAAFGKEAVENLTAADRTAALRARFPEIFILVFVGLALLLRGPAWSDAAVHRVHDRSSEAVRGTLVFLVSLGGVALPLAGVVLLLLALSRADILGPLGEQMTSLATLLALNLLVARWLALRVFRPRETDEAAGLLRSERRELRVETVLLAFLLWVVMAVAWLESLGLISETSRGILFFGPTVLAALILLRMGRIVLHGARAITSDEPNMLAATGRAAGHAMRIVGALGPIAAIAGYANLSARLVFASILSLVLVALIVVLQDLADETYRLVTRRSRERAREALAPVLIGFSLVLLSLPLFALIWGARTTDIAELWAHVQQGFTVGETRISPVDFLFFVVVFTVGLILTRLLQSTLRNSVLPRTSLDPGGRNAIAVGVGYVGIFLAAVLAITSAGIDMSSFAIVAGALSVGIGFGLQNIVSNFVSGIILLIERPISEGDWIEVNGRMGYVRSISVRSTRIETFDRTDVIVPNADFVSGTVTNWTRGNLTGRAIVPVGVAYGSDTRHVERILHEVAESHPMVSLNPAPLVLFTGFGESSMNFEIRAILRDVNWLLTVKSELNHAIARRFAEEGIEIPFAQRVVWLRNHEELQSGTDTAATDELAKVVGRLQGTGT